MTKGKDPSERTWREYLVAGPGVFGSVMIGVLGLICLLIGSTFMGFRSYGKGYVEAVCSVTAKAGFGYAVQLVDASTNTFDVYGTKNTNKYCISAGKGCVVMNCCDLNVTVTPVDGSVAPYSDTMFRRACLSNNTVSDADRCGIYLGGFTQLWGGKTRQFKEDGSSTVDYEYFFPCWSSPKLAIGNGGDRIQSMVGCPLPGNMGSCNTLNATEWNHFNDDMAKYNDMFYAAIVLIVWGCITAVAYIGFCFAIYWSDEKY